MIKYKGFTMERDKEKGYEFFLFKDTDGTNYRQMVYNEKHFKQSVDRHLSTRLKFLQDELRFLSEQLDYYIKKSNLNLVVINETELEQFLELKDE